VEAFVLSFGVILLAELGDKSQLITVALTARYRPAVVLAGIAMAAALINGVAVVIGVAFAAMLPLNVLQAVGGVLFLVFAAVTLWRTEDDDEELRAPISTRWAVVAVAAAFFVAELGDKTQLATIALAATNDAAMVWLGATAAEIAVNATTVGVASFIGSRLKAGTLRLVGALGFLVFGVLLLLEAFGLFQIG
jgi:putative Ca2+/H+ antiporter (TMEM165/GDT1 family)